MTDDAIMTAIDYVIKGQVSLKKLLMDLQILVPYKYTILAKDVRVGDTIIIDPMPEGGKQHMYAPYDDFKIKVIDIINLPTGNFYFIYGERSSIHVSADENLVKELSLKDTLRKL